MPKKTGRKPISESKAMQETLKDLFLEGGMTPYQAAKNLGIDFKTAQNYFVKFVKELLMSPFFWSRSCPEAVVYRGEL